jgi:hypothetical protein
MIGKLECFPKKSFIKFVPPKKLSFYFGADCDFNGATTFAPITLILNFFMSVAYSRRILVTCARASMAGIVLYQPWLG